MPHKCMSMTRSWSMFPTCLIFELGSEFRAVSVPPSADIGIMENGIGNTLNLHNKRMDDGPIDML